MRKFSFTCRNATILDNFGNGPTDSKSNINAELLRVPTLFLLRALSRKLIMTNPKNLHLRCKQLAVLPK